MLRILASSIFFSLSFMLRWFFKVEIREVTAKGLNVFMQCCLASDTAEGQLKDSYVLQQSMKPSFFNRQKLTLSHALH